MSDRERFEALFREHTRELLAYALRRVDRAEDAADVVSEAMLVAWRRLDDVPAGVEARLWLFGVARLVLSNLRRTNLRGSRLGARLRKQLAGAFHDDHADRVGTSLIVREALARLDADDAEMLRLSAWEGLTPTEIAAVMSISSATARTRLHRARGRFRTELERIDAAGHVDHDGHVLVRKVEAES